MLSLLPSDEDQGITRIDPALRKMMGVSIDDTVTIRKISEDVVSDEKPQAYNLRKPKHQWAPPWNPVRMWDLEGKTQQQPPFLPLRSNVCPVRFVHRV